jgi:hypothetical protein
MAKGCYMCRNAIPTVAHDDEHMLVVCLADKVTHVEVFDNCPNFATGLNVEPEEVEVDSPTVDNEV